MRGIAQTLGSLQKKDTLLNLLLVLSFLIAVYALASSPSSPRRTDVQPLAEYSTVHIAPLPEEQYVEYTEAEALPTAPRQQSSQAHVTAVSQEASSSQAEVQQPRSSYDFFESFWRMLRR